MRLFCVLSLIFTGFTVFAQTPTPPPEKTKADTNREVIRTYARVYLESKEYPKADEMVSDYLKTDAADPNLWVLLGQIQMKERRLNDACTSFKNATGMFKDSENRLYAGYSLADCLNQSSRNQDATVVLQKIIADQGDYTTAPADALDQIRTGKIRNGQALPVYKNIEHGKWRVSGAFGSGFDTNVLLVDEDVISNTSVSDRGSFFVTPAVQVGYAGHAFGDAFDSRYIASFTDYLNSAAASFNSLYQRADFSFGSGPIRWGAFGDTLFLNRLPFQLYDWEMGVSYLNIRKATASFVETWEIPLKFQKYTLDSNSSPENDRTGEDIQFKGTRRWIRGQHQLLNLEGIFDFQWTKGQNYRLLGLDIPALYMTEIPGFISLGLVNTFSAEAQGQYYLQSDTTRRDLLLKADMGVLKSINDELNLSVDLGYQKNLSSVMAARYNKTVISMQLSHDFL